MRNKAAIFTGHVFRQSILISQLWVILVGMFEGIAWRLINFGLIEEKRKN